MRGWVGGRRRLITCKHCFLGCWVLHKVYKYLIYYVFWLCMCLCMYMYMHAKKYLYIKCNKLVHSTCITKCIGSSMVIGPSISVLFKLLTLVDRS